MLHIMNLLFIMYETTRHEQLSFQLTTMNIESVGKGIKDKNHVLDN
jgi:hypothetical protein